MTAPQLGRVVGRLGKRLAPAAGRMRRPRAARRPVLGLSRREQGLCACLLAMIVLVSATGAWLTWRALKDEQLQLEAQSAAKTGVTDEHTLETDLTKRDAVGLTKQSAPGATGRTASSERNGRSGGAAPSLKTSKPTTIDGTVVASVVTVVLLGAAAGAARLVLARYRRQHEQDVETGGTEGRYLDLIGDEPDGDMNEVEADEGALSEDAALPRETKESEQPDPAEERQQPAATDPAELERAGLEISEGRSGAESLLVTHSTELPGAESLPLDSSLVPAPRSSTWEARQEASIAGGSSWSLDSPLAEESSSSGVPTRDAASENIFDRRVARRVPYVESAWLWWGDANGPVMVQDLSATGLRLRFPPSGSTPPPTLGQPLRLFFPVSGTTIKAEGRVQWRRTVDGATEVGLKFLDLSAGDQELIQSVLLAAQ